MSEQRDARSNLVSTKLQRPRLNWNLVERPRLTGLLDRGLDTRLTLVCAPAGYGKTTLLSTWIQERPARCCWVTLDGNDNDLVAFLSYVVAAIRTQFPDACTTTQSLVRALQIPPREHLTTSLVNELSELREPVCLVLDDYHEIHQDEIHQVVLGLIRYPSPQLNLFITSRHDPSFSLARLRGAQQLLEIRANDLRFTNAEARQYLQKMLDVEIEPALVSELVERTEGWPVGLRMAALGMRHHDDPATFVAGFDGDHRYVTNYLVDEVFARQPRAVREFLLYTSVLDRFCAGLCDAVVGQGAQPRLGEVEGSVASDEDVLSSREILKQLDRSNLFVMPLDPEGAWYRYHSLFRDLLAHRLNTETSKAERVALHIAASAWLEQHGFLDEALRHRLAANDFSGIIESIRRNRYALMNDTEWQRLERWLQAVPHDIVDEYPDLLMLKAWLLYHHGRYQELPTALQRVESSLKRARLDADAIHHLQGELSALDSLLRYDAADPARTIAAARQSIEKTAPELWIVRILARMMLAGVLQMTGDLPSAYETIYAGYEEREAQSNRFKSILLSTACWLHWVTADLRGLAQTADQSIALGQGQQMPEFAGWSHHHRGCAAYHLNELEAAEEHFATVVHQPYLNYGQCYLYAACGLALTYQAQDRPDDARATAEAAVAFLLETGNTTLLPVAQSFQAELALRQGETAFASHWAVRFDPVPSLSPLVQFFVPHLTLVKVWLAQDTPDSWHRADELLRRLREFVENTHNTRYQIEVLALQALLHLARNEMSDARSVLEQAIDLAQTGRFIRLFVDLGPSMADLLADRQSGGRTPSHYVDQIIDAFSAQGSSRRHATPSDVEQSHMVETLTDREIDVLRLLTEHRSNKEIAAALVISLNTVSTHTRNIYAKLDVHSRRQAVARAQELGLLQSD